MVLGAVRTIILSCTVLPAALTLGLLIPGDAGAQKQVGMVGMLLPASLNPTTTRITGELARGAT